MEKFSSFGFQTKVNEIIGNVTIKELYSSITNRPVDTTRYTYLVNKLLGIGKHVLLVGTAATGKTRILNDAASESKYQSLSIHFSSQTDASYIQEIIEGRFDKQVTSNYQFNLYYFFIINFIINFLININFIMNIYYYKILRSIDLFYEYLKSWKYFFLK